MAYLLFASGFVAKMGLYNTAARQTQNTRVKPNTLCPTTVDLKQALSNGTSRGAGMEQLATGCRQIRDGAVSDAGNTCM